MKKTTKDKISKFLFNSLNEEQTIQLQDLFERPTIFFDPPVLKVINSQDCGKIEINLIPSSYGS